MTKLHTLEEYHNALQVLNGKTDKLEISYNLHYLFNNLDLDYAYINDNNESRLHGNIIDIYFKNPETQVVYKAWCTPDIIRTIRQD
ncbi:hypothetical protein [Staphylococcus phage PMBT8]|nr:hypothetical protein [Staphylococcus phage PMBT8]